MMNRFPQAFSNPMHTDAVRHSFPIRGAQNAVRHIFQIRCAM